MTSLRRLRRLGYALLPFALALAMVSPAAGAPASGPLAAADPSQVSFTLEGCKIGAGEVLPASLLCPDAEYTTGNLGKEWNELDLVPHRVTTNAGNAAPATQTYSIAITADNLKAGSPGYDVIGTPSLNASKSDASCALSFTGQGVLIPGVGGMDESIYRVLTITQAKNSTCVIDYVERLALGSHLFPGSSLHSNLLNQNFGSAGVGSKDVSIPVNEIEPQELDKDMTATQGADHTWNLTKSPSPAALDFGNTCAPGATLSTTVQITISWTKSPAIPTEITVTTNIYATNPAHRTITTTVSDAIRSGTTVLDTAGPVTEDVPANTANFLMFTHTTTLPAGTTDINDVATATYVDTTTGVPVPGNTTATATANVQVTETNATATITDSESITGTGLSFSVAAPSVGAFTGGYTAGTQTTGPVGWSSGTQSSSGSVTFDKTIYLDQVRVTSGTLSDSAQLTGSDGFATGASLSVGIQSSAQVSLTINKTIPAILQAGETQTFGFNVTGPGGYASTVNITFGAGETSKSVTIGGLAPGTYIVAEQPTPGWLTAPSQTVAIDLPNCAASVVIANSFAPANARAQKITNPAGSEAGWLLTLSGPGGPVSATTTGAGFVTFPLDLQEGTYTITETPQAGWDQTGASAECSFTVSYPADLGRLFSCSVTNTARGKILVRKLTDPASDTTTSFGFNTSGGGYAGFSLTNGQTNDSGYLLPGTYSVSETVPAGWDLTGASCDGGNAPASINLAPGQTVTCLFTNRQRGHIIVTKRTIPAGSAASFSFSTTGSSYSGFSLSDAQSNDSGALVPGTYSVAENVPAGWDLTSATCDGGNTPAQINLGAGQTVNCTFVNTQRGKVLVRKATIPQDSTTSFGFNATGNGYAGFTLMNGETNDSGWLQPGAYTVSETTPAGWDLTSATCDLGNTPASINLGPGQTVTCLFTNTQRGKILVRKITDPSTSTQNFNFSTTGSGYASFGLTNGQTNDSGYLVPGAYSVSETVPAGWDLASATCTGGNTPASINLGPGQTVTCTFTNRQRGHIIVTKRTDPAGSTQSFTFTTTGAGYAGFSLSDGQSNDSGELVPGAYTVAETVPSGWDLTSATCSGGNTPASINLQAGQTVNCTFVNRQRGKAQVIKTVQGAAPTGAHAFTFQLRQGASPTQTGTTLETLVANAANGGVLNFNTQLIPGQTYQLCEIVMPAWLTSLGTFVPDSFNPPDGTVPNPNVDNSIVCGNFTVSAGETKLFTIDNTPPPGGRALTIGFWKNWASCTKGGQKPVLDNVLYDAQQAGTPITVGDLILQAGSNRNAATDCAKATAILNKSDWGNGKKMASNEAYNLAAQLLATKLNFAAGSGVCGAAITAATQAQALLDLIGFTGTGTNTMTPAQRTLANQLAKILDDYNNNRLC